MNLRLNSAPLSFAPLRNLSPMLQTKSMKKATPFPPSRLRVFARTLLLFCLFLVSCDLSLATQIPITILHTTDLHAHIKPTTDYGGNKDVGGLARCATKIKEIRSTAQNVLLVDAGDLYQGTALGYLTEGAVMIRSLNALKYDAWEPGNHEFDWGIDKFAARVSETTFPVISANLHYKEPSVVGSQSSAIGDRLLAITSALQKLQPYIIREFNGVKIGIVGLDTPGIPNWSRPRLIPGLTVEDSLSALRRVIPEMKAKGCQILVLVTHQGLRDQGDDHANQIIAIARSFPEIDVIVGGHSHQLRPDQRVSGVLYSQANYWGTYLGRVDLVYDTTLHRLISKKGSAIPIDTTVPEDEEILALNKEDLLRTNRYLFQNVGKAAEKITSLTGPKKETPGFNLLCSSIAEAVRSRGGRVDAVVHGILSPRDVIEPGPITMGDIFHLVPYENTIGVASLSRNELLEILEENASAYHSDRFRGVWGLTMKLRPSDPKGKRILFLGDANGRALPENTRLWVAFNSYDLASGGQRWKRLREIVDRPAAQLKEYDFQTRDAVVEYVKKHSPLKAEMHGWWSTERKSVR